MSASLVGSEMCIRDRLVTDGTTPASDRRALQLRDRSPTGPSPTNRPLAVSYTHLTLPTICSV
eukprot:12597062-Alexandrium_andersonii.AAC.1